MSDVVVTGGLCHAGLRAVVLGADVRAEPLAGSAGCRLVGLSAQQAARLAFYADVIGPEGGGPDPTGEALALAAAIMERFGAVAPERLRARLPQMQISAAARLRAAALAPARLRHSARAGDVATASRRAPYEAFFAVEEEVLRYRRFDGSLSPPVLRATFVSGDAATVLPYDPLRDRVLVIEQFRAGPHARGDANPWQLEAIAGRIDPGETPEAAARREAVEEAGLTLGPLLPVAGYYPTPGIAAEFLYSFVGLCDLPDGAAGVFGVEGEAEDIRGHLIGFDDLMALVTSGEAGNAPLILTALWLQRERGRLRAGL